jgi:hypothetical protein
MTVKVPRGNMNGTTHVGGECYWVTVPICDGGDGTGEPNVGTLKVNFGGSDWEMKLVFRGNDYMLVSIIYLTGLQWL